jgi:hypothetical protein
MEGQEEVWKNVAIGWCRKSTLQWRKGERNHSVVVQIFGFFVLFFHEKYSSPRSERYHVVLLQQQQDQSA